VVVLEQTATDTVKAANGEEEKIDVTLELKLSRLSDIAYIAEGDVIGAGTLLGLAGKADDSKSQIAVELTVGKAGEAQRRTLSLIGADEDMRLGAIRMEIARGFIKAFGADAETEASMLAQVREGLAKVEDEISKAEKGLDRINAQEDPDEVNKAIEGVVDAEIKAQRALSFEKAIEEKKKDLAKLVGEEEANRIVLGIG